MSSTSKSWDYNIQGNKVRVTFALDEYQLKMLDKIKRAMHSTSRSEICRKILDAYMFDYSKMVNLFEVLTEEQISKMGM